MHDQQQGLFCSRTPGSDVGDAQAYMYSCRSSMHIVRTEQNVRGWIVCGSPGVLFCSTGRRLSLSCLTTVRRCPQIFSNASCFALGTDLRGIRSNVFSWQWPYCHGTLQGRGLLRVTDSQRLLLYVETLLIRRSHRGYNSSSCELVKCFELKASDGELRRSCLR